MKNLVPYSYQNSSQDDDVNYTAFFLAQFDIPYYHSYFCEVVFKNHELDKKFALDIIKFLNKEFNLSLIPVYQLVNYIEFINSRKECAAIYWDEKNKLVLKIDSWTSVEKDRDFNSFNLRFLYKEQNWSKLIEFLDIYSRFKSIKKEIPKVNILGYNNQTGFYTSEFEIRDSNIQILENYNDDFEEIDKIIKEFIKTKDQSGLVMLHGLPGTGKTFYVRHILKWAIENAPDNKVIYIPVTMSSELTNPNFIPFLTKQIGATIIIEDAERVITSREDGGGGNAVSGILNLSDGILGDIFKLKIILSFNMDVDKVDSALMRKGRLKAKYEFGKLTQGKSTALLEKLGKNAKADAPMTLTEIFNFDDKEFNGEKPKKSMGFGV